MQHILGNESEQFYYALSGKSPVAVRLNPCKGSLRFITDKQVPWCKEGRYLPSRPIYTLDPLFHAGAYYVQEPSSMFLNEVVRQLELNKSPIRVLDLCAAPGGKTTLLLSSLNSKSLIVANETIRGRCGMLAENLTKWGNSNFIVTNNDPSAFGRIPGFFNLLLIDAPCSGEGLFRKDEQAVKYWSKKNVDICSARQKRILCDALPALSLGGLLIYCTCTFSEEENENNIQWLSEHKALDSVRLNINEEWGIKEIVSEAGGKTLYGYRFYPHKLAGEGFFISCMRKSQNEEKLRSGHYSSNLLSNVQKNKQKRSCLKSIDKAATLKLLFLLSESDDCLFTFNSMYYRLGNGLSAQIEKIIQELNTYCLGGEVAEIRGNDVVPSHQFALSGNVNSSVPVIDLNEEQALRYLRKQDVAYDNKNPDGWYIVRNSGLNIGWIKIANGKLKNHYPKEWRVRKGGAL